MYKYMLMDIDGILLDTYAETKKSYKLAFLEAGHTLGDPEFDHIIWGYSWGSVEKTYSTLDCSAIHARKQQIFDLGGCTRVERNIVTAKLWLNIEAITAFTSSSNAKQKLDYCGLDIPYIEGVDKSDPCAVLKHLAAMDKKPSECCLYDDNPANLQVFKTLGGFTLLGVPR